MRNKITVIITIRNREAARIKNQVESIRATGADPSFHIVDYGSSNKFANEYKKVCEQLQIQYTHMYAEGLPWNKCRALNYGAKVAKTPFIVTSDVDIIYESNPFQWCLDNYTEKSMYHIETYWLPKSGNKQKSKYAGHGNSGGFQFITKKAFFDIGGYDERMVYWGLEDLDWPYRLQTQGYSQIWLPDTYKIYHVWHPVSESGNLRPITASINSIKYSYENMLTPIHNTEYGNSIIKNTRPILSYIDNVTPHILHLETNEFIHWKAAEKIIDFLKKNDFVKIELGSRLKKRPLDKFRNFIKKLFKPLTALTGTKIVDNTNESFDYLYELIPLFERELIRDYFISDDLSSIYCLRKN